VFSVEDLCGGPVKLQGLDILIPFPMLVHVG